MDKSETIFVAGHNGLVGSALCRELREQGYHVITADRRSYDLRNPRSVDYFFKHLDIDHVFLAAAKVGGIQANMSRKADFIYDNLMIQTNVIDTAYQHGVKKLLFLGSSCIYPKNAFVPINEDQLLTGVLEPTNDAYAIAKIAGIKMCQAYSEQHDFNAISVMPTNLYGPNDNFDLYSSHVLPAMIRRFYEAKMRNDPHVVCWGDGSPMREFLHVDDLAKACVHLMNTYDSGDIVNVGTGVDVTIKELAETIASTVGYEGEIKWDTSKPNGTHRKVLDVSKINSLGSKAQIELKEGIKNTYEWYLRDLDRRNQITL